MAGLGLGRAGGGVPGLGILLGGFQNDANLGVAQICIVLFIIFTHGAISGSAYRKFHAHIPRSALFRVVPRCSALFRVNLLSVSVRRARRH